PLRPGDGQCRPGPPPTTAATSAVDLPGRGVDRCARPGDLLLRRVHGPAGRDRARGVGLPPPPGDQADAPSAGHGGRAAAAALAGTDRRGDTRGGGPAGPGRALDGPPDDTDGPAGSTGPSEGHLRSIT